MTLFDNWDFASGPVDTKSRGVARRVQKSRSSAPKVQTLPYVFDSFWRGQKASLANGPSHRPGRPVGEGVTFHP